MTFISRCGEMNGKASQPALRIAALSAAGLRLSDAGKTPSVNTGLQRDDKQADRATPRILIVEDVLFVAWELESHLRELGFEVCGMAADGEDAIDLAADLSPNLLLMDLNLGEGMDGIEAARRILATRDAALVFVTAYSDAANRARIEQAFPGTPVVTKPVTRERLRAAVAAARK